MSDAATTFQIRGGRQLEGSINVRGAKNSVPNTMVAALLTDQTCRITNVARVRDVFIAAELIEAVGGEAKIAGDEVVVTATHLQDPDENHFSDLHSRSRIPVLVCGPLLHRQGTVTIHRPGGCEIGGRPVNMHIAALTSFGAEVQDKGDRIILVADRLRGAVIDLPYPSVGATEQVLLTAVLAEGDTELRNAAVEPEIMDLIGVLVKMGAIISVLPGRVVRVQGVQRLRGFVHRSMPDRLETASWACAALATNGRITVKGIGQLDTMFTFFNTFRRAGGDFDVDGDEISFYRRDAPLQPLALETDVHPGFMTDWQPPLMTALTQAPGVSVLHETVYENRLGYTSALNQLGAQIQTFRECLGPMPCRFGHRRHLHSAVVVGPTPLRGGTLVVPDLRGGFSYMIAAAAAKGTSVIHNVDLIDRGYERFREKLEAVGVAVS
ncbi:MAG: UDP-N-acetylglucosamine 1-carboxyvinyltransferase [Actinomycetota bacterium]